MTGAPHVLGPGSPRVADSEARRRAQPPSRRHARLSLQPYAPTVDRVKLHNLPRPIPPYSPFKYDDSSLPCASSHHTAATCRCRGARARWRTASQPARPPRASGVHECVHVLPSMVPSSLLCVPKEIHNINPRRTLEKQTIMASARRFHHRVHRHQSDDELLRRISMGAFGGPPKNVSIDLTMLYRDRIIEHRPRWQ